MDTWTRLRLGVSLIVLWIGPIRVPAVEFPADIPLPEHPRPDFQRADWLNLNGTWAFQFDPENIGEKKLWHQDRTEFNQQIRVPFPWGSPLSGVSNQADVAWYQRRIQVPESWKAHGDTRPVTVPRRPQVLAWPGLREIFVRPLRFYLSPA